MGAHSTTPDEQILEYIRANISDQTYQEMADSCECSLSKISTLIRKWKESGEFEDWLFEKYFKLHRQMETLDPQLAYKGILRLVERHVTQKIKTESKVEIEVGDQFKDLVRRLLGDHVMPDPKPTD